MASSSGRWTRFVPVPDAAVECAAGGAAVRCHAVHRALARRGELNIHNCRVTAVLDGPPPAFGHGESVRITHPCRHTPTSPPSRHHHQRHLRRTAVLQWVRGPGSMNAQLLPRTPRDGTKLWRLFDTAAPPELIADGIVWAVRGSCVRASAGCVFVTLEPAAPGADVPPLQQRFGGLVQVVADGIDADRAHWDQEVLNCAVRPAFGTTTVAIELVRAMNRACAPPPSVAEPPSTFTMDVRLLQQGCADGAAAAATATTDHDTWLVVTLRPWRAARDLAACPMFSHAAVCEWRWAAGEEEGLGLILQAFNRGLTRVTAAASRCVVGSGGAMLNTLTAWMDARRQWPLGRIQWRLHPHAHQLQAGLGIQPRPARLCADGSLHCTHSAPPGDGDRVFVSRRGDARWTMASTHLTRGGVFLLGLAPRLVQQPADGGGGDGDGDECKDGKSAAADVLWAPVEHCALELSDGLAQAVGAERIELRSTVAGCEAASWTSPARMSAMAGVRTEVDLSFHDDIIASGSITATPDSRGHPAQAVIPLAIPAHLFSSLDHVPMSDLRLRVRPCSWAVGAAWLVETPIHQRDAAAATADADARQARARMHARQARRRRPTH